MINESCHLSSKVEIMVSICLIASCKYKKHAIFLSCFGDFSDSSYFLPGLFRILGWVWDAVLGISAVSATFFCFFPAFWAGFGWIWGAVCGIYAVSATFFCSFPDFGAGFGVLFWWFQHFQLLFPVLFRLSGWIFGCCLGNLCDFSSTRPACYAINLWLLYIMIIEKSSIF